MRLKTPHVMLAAIAITNTGECHYVWVRGSDQACLLLSLYAATYGERYDRHWPRRAV
eukprot:CAMPEP_0183369408 /NCGR_PEP_ID=MMETSP0164_2-20130417/99218_1 /TAXON_ID=221442 /ORGANISM="Coccolithus pelagicus ssp braarudi, Strain PLY182g" /LENGTH=56 /DNA_ID=CAMNT_0025545665 /DNA_START=194 /DNA_END=361 /DNA_ORIENTATION=+